MSKTILRFTIRFSKATLIAILLASYALFRSIRLVAHGVELALVWGGEMAGVFTPLSQDSRENDFTQKFRDGELLKMAKQISTPNMTINEVCSQFGVSYRQGRKIKSIADKLSNIHIHTPDIHPVSG